MAVGTKLFQLLTKALRSLGNLATQVRTAWDWFNMAQQVIHDRHPDLTTGAMARKRQALGMRPMTTVSPNHIGRMIMFSYSAKDTGGRLPYWDASPIIFLLKFYHGKGAGFLGINLHYIPPILRLKLLNAIYDHYRMRHYDEKRRLQLSYETLNSSARFRWFRPCVKRYLFTHVKSRFFLVDPEHWDRVALVPPARWQKGGTNSKVYADSKRKIRVGG